MNTTSTVSTLDKPGLTIKTTHFRLLVADYDAEFRFFRDVLGFKPTFGAEGENYADFDCNGVWVALFKRNLMSAAIGAASLPADVAAQDSVALIFAVPDVDEAVAQAKQHGLPILAEPNDRPDWGVRVAHFRSPDGNLIEVNQGLAPAAG